MSLVKLIPKLDDDYISIDVQFTNNYFGVWIDLIENDSTLNYPKTLFDNRITQDSWLRFRIKDENGSFSDWSEASKP